MHALPRGADGLRMPRWPQLLCAIASLIIAFKALIVHFEIPLGLVDDALVVFVLGGTLTRAFVTGHLPRFDLILIAAVAYLVLISLVGLQPERWRQLGQVLIHVKFFCLYVFIRNLSTGKFRRVWIDRIFVAIIAISILGFSINLVMQDAFLAMFNVKFAEASRGGLARIVGFQLKPNDIAFLFALFYAYIVANRIGRWGLHKIALISLTVATLIFLNGSRTALAIFPLIAYLICKERKMTKIPMILFGIAVLIILASSSALDYALTETAKNIGEFSRISQSQYIRAIMIYFGAVLMCQNFPIGTGAATFGSVLSDNSPVYAQLHLLHLPFFQKMEGIYDSNLATIMGEFGFLGLLIFYGFLFVIYQDLKKLGNKSPLQNRYWKIIIVFAAFISITNPFFQYSYNGLIFSLAMLCGLGLKNKHDESECDFKIEASNRNQRWPELQNNRWF
jgi:hypothetical protein